MTIDDKKKALIDAGKKIRSNASEEDIEMAYLELEAEQEAANPAPDGPPVEPEGTSEVASAPVTSSKDALEAVLRSADPMMGDKDPKVIKWCRENLSDEEYEARYSGRNFDRV